MSDVISINAEIREDVGKGASRRLRHEGKVPAVIYGGHKDAVSLTLQQHQLLHEAENESFYSTILELQVGEKKKQQVVVRDMHRHPYKPVIMHIDFMRVSAKEILKISVPIHFVDEDESPAGKTSGVVIQHHMTEVEISALPRNVPEFLSVDLSEMDAGDTVMLSAIDLPEGVEIVAMAGEDAIDMPIANAVHVKESQGADVEPEVDEDILLEGAEGAEGDLDDEEEEPENE